MRRASTILLAIGVAVLATSGCDEGETNGDKFDAAVDDYEGILEARIGVTCSCFEEFGYASLEDCKVGEGELDPDDRACRRNAYYDDFPVSRRHVDCVLAAETDYDACLYQNLQCDDAQSSSRSCTETWTAARERCIALPVSIQNDIELCGA